MAKYNPKIHHRKSIRFKGYDYSKSGLYFITINCQNKVYRFGDVINEEMKLNEFGKIAHEEWIKLEDRFPNFELDVFQIMPNHMHGIISLRNNDAFDTVEKLNEITERAGFTPAFSNDNDFNNRATARVAPAVAPTVGDIIGAYKSLVANACLDIYKSRNEIMGKFWQRDYYDIIIRDARAYLQISKYIENNPKNWKKDKFYRK